jgi:hypothetical protein
MLFGSSQPNPKILSRSDRDMSVNPSPCSAIARAVQRGKPITALAAYRASAALSCFLLFNSFEKFRIETVVIVIRIVLLLYRTILAIQH